MDRTPDGDAVSRDDATGTEGMTHAKPRNREESGVRIFAAKERKRTRKGFLGVAEARLLFLRSLRSFAAIHIFVLDSRAGSRKKMTNRINTATAPQAG